MLEKELLAALALQKAEGIGAINAKKLIQQCGSAEQVFKEKKSTLTKIYNIGSATLQFLNDKELLNRAEKELKYIQQAKIAYSYYLDDVYPKRLKHCKDGPILLFNDGVFDLENPRIISIVGTRNMTLRARDFIMEFVCELAAYQPLIVSGFAYGVDITAHRAALEHNLQTIAILAHGLDDIYPRAHKKYMHKMLQNGGFMTEFWHDDQPLREHFLQRNRVVAGISEATVIIESAARGGSLVTATIANSYNRDVFAVPGRPTDAMSKGCNTLIKRNQAALLSTPTDLVEALNWDVQLQQSKGVQRQLFFELDEIEQRIHTYLSENGKTHLDTIAIACDIPVYSLATQLFNLEMKGAVKALQGKLFEAIN